MIRALICNEMNWELYTGSLIGKFIYHCIPTTKDSAQVRASVKVHTHTSRS